jgi:hypothetical protein
MFTFECVEGKKSTATGDRSSSVFDRLRCPPHQWAIMFGVAPIVIVLGGPEDGGHPVYLSRGRRSLNSMNIGALS